MKNIAWYILEVQSTSKGYKLDKELEKSLLCPVYRYILMVSNTAGHAQSYKPGNSEVVHQDGP